MATQTAFGTLNDLASRASDEAATRLGQAIQVSAQAQEKLNLLIDYQHECVKKLGQRVSSGLSAGDHLNFHDFIAGLERAISQQRQVCKCCQQADTHALELWRASELKRLSYETLEQRQTHCALRREGRLEQKRSDEHAARSRSTQH